MYPKWQGGSFTNLWRRRVDVKFCGVDPVTGRRSQSIISNAGRLSGHTTGPEELPAAKEGNGVKDGFCAPNSVKELAV